MRSMSTTAPSRCSSSKSWIQAAPPSGQAQLVGALGDHAQAEVLQHRQHVRDRDRVAELDDLQVHALGALARRAVQVQSAARCGCARSASRSLEVLEHFLRARRPPRRRAGRRAGNGRRAPGRRLAAARRSVRRAGGRPRSSAASAMLLLDAGEVGLAAARPGRCARRRACARGWSRRSARGSPRWCRPSPRARSARCARALRCCSDHAARRPGRSRSGGRGRVAPAGAPCAARTG